MHVAELMPQILLPHGILVTEGLHGLSRFKGAVPHCLTLQLRTDMMFQGAGWLHLARGSLRL